MIDQSQLLRLLGLTEIAIDRVEIPDADVLEIHVHSTRDPRRRTVPALRPTHHRVAWTRPGTAVAPCADLRASHRNRHSAQALSLSVSPRPSHHHPTVGLVRPAQHLHPCVRTQPAAWLDQQHPRRRRSQGRHHSGTTRRHPRSPRPEADRVDGVRRATRARVRRDRLDQRPRQLRGDRQRRYRGHPEHPRRARKTARARPSRRFCAPSPNP
jgi:hypothetical protein